jgi:excisionase family DNA binding protein
MPESDPVFSVVEAASYLKRSVRGLYQLMSRGRVSYTRPAGGRAYFRQSDLDAFLAQGRHAASFEIADRADAALNARR